MVVNPWWAEAGRLHPYSELRKQKSIIRTFSVEVDSEELVWHRDHNDRIVTIVEGKDWRLQMDNQLPITLKPGDSINITKNTYHRILKGTTDLVVEILER